MSRQSSEKRAEKLKAKEAAGNKRRALALEKKARRIEEQRAREAARLEENANQIESLRRRLEFLDKGEIEVVRDYPPDSPEASVMETIAQVRAEKVARAGVIDAGDLSPLKPLGSKSESYEYPVRVAREAMNLLDAESSVDEDDGFDHELRMIARARGSPRRFGRGRARGWTPWPDLGDDEGSGRQESD